MDEPRKPKGKPFQKGSDPRRHTFTQEECRRGFAAAEAKFISLYGGKEGHWRIRAKIGVKPMRELLRPYADLTEEQFAAMCRDF